MDDDRSAEPAGLPSPPPPGGGRPGRPHSPRLPAAGGVPGIPPVPPALAHAVDPDTPFRRGEPRPAEADDDGLGWSWPMPPPPAVGPLPPPPPPRPLVASSERRRRRRRRAGADAADAWLVSPPTDADAWRVAADDLEPTPVPLAAPPPRTRPWRAVVAAVALIAVAVLAGLALSDDRADSVVDARPPSSFAEEPAVELEADVP